MVNFAIITKLTADISACNPDEVNKISLGNAVKRDTDTAWVNSPGTVVQSPDSDSFYDFLTPDQVGKYSLGDIIKYREIGIVNATNIAGAWQFVFRSENSSGAAIGALTTIIVPQNNDNKNVAVYPQPEDSNSINCASSYTLVTGGLVFGMQQVLDAGVALNIPDHEGFNSSYISGILEGKITLDSIRALEKSRDITGISNDRYVVAGYSGGSFATGWAAELQPSYAADLNIIAFSMGGYLNDPRGILDEVNGTPYANFIPGAILGLASEYSDMWDVLNTELKPESVGTFLAPLTMCDVVNAPEFVNLSFSDYFTDGLSVLDTDTFKIILENNTLGKQVPKAPMIIYNGVADQIVPIESVDKLVEFYCNQGANIIYDRGAGEDHLGMGALGISLTLNFFIKAFAGDVPNGCSFEGAIPAFAGNFSGSYDGLANPTATSSANSTVSRNSSHSSFSTGNHSSGTSGMAITSVIASVTEFSPNRAAISAASPSLFGILFTLFALL